MQARKRVCIFFVFRYKHLFSSRLFDGYFYENITTRGEYPDWIFAPRAMIVLLNQPIRSSVRKRSPDGGAGCC